MSGKGDTFVRWFSELTHDDLEVAGGKGASLAEMYNNKFPIPPGFVVTAQAYQHFLAAAGLTGKITEVLSGLDVNDTEALAEASKKIRAMMEAEEFPADLEEAIVEAYDILDVDKKGLEGASGSALAILKTGHEPPFVAVRSSATAEDLADASFAGQQDSFLNVKGPAQVLQKVRQCFSSLFTARAIYYREKKGFKHEETSLAAVVQKMIDADKAGVMFSQHPTKHDESVMIEAVWGLGEGIVSGRIKPDHYEVTREEEKFEVLDEQIAEKGVAVVRDSGGKTDVVKLTEERSKQRVLSSYELKRLAQFGVALEEHYGKPQDIEFALEGKDFYIVQSRPITTLGKQAPAVAGGEEEVHGEALLSGLGASPGVSSGTVKVVHSMEELDKVKKGDVLVTKMTNPDMVVTMQRAAAIVTDEGGVTSHAAIVSREMGIPAVVGTGDATEKLHDGGEITVDGNSGKVVSGRGKTQLAEVERMIEGTKIKIKVIVDLPDAAHRAAKSGAKAVGLTRLEGIIAAGGKHPLAFVKEEKLKDYIALLSAGLSKIAQPFEEVWVRSSDIRSDEYRHLVGAPKELEGNPMLGDHGIRFSLRHPGLLKAELQAIKEVADEFPDKTFGVMVPQVIGEGDFLETKKLADEVGMPENVKLGIMVETPAAVQIINKLCEAGISFASFGTNDLTQYTLAVDRNNGDVQYLYDELHPSVLHSLMYVIRRCRHHGVETSICGQAGSKEEMARFLVRQGIDSISVNADAAKGVSEIVLEEERRIAEEAGSDGGKKEERPGGTHGEDGVQEGGGGDGFVGKKKKKRRRRRKKNRGQQGVIVGEGSSGPVEQQASPQGGGDYGVAVVSALEGSNDNGVAEVVAEQEVSNSEVSDAEELSPSDPNSSSPVSAASDVPELNNSIPVSSGDTILEDKGEVIELADSGGSKTSPEPETSDSYVEVSEDEKSAVKSMFDDSEKEGDEVTNLF
ncbi:phosphoenolpyruvate synthase [Candidatus Pacearchaeota archaeon]|nr:phosphoenolpyruvate synthase [Candidatus Pacearchaeota archaeon]